MVTKGQKINDRYEIIKTIGEGGMANVYLAYDVILDRKVAVKILRGDLATDEKFVRRFQREALSASSLSHPNIVEVYDVGEDNGMYYIVMEYVKGQHLKDIIKKRGNLTVTEVIDYMLQITDGMAHAHDSYIIHRDIKPQNIIVLDNGLAKITDFGIATALNSTQLTQTNSVMGTVHYLPPEQANGKKATIKSDIYSMGILMYELLTGKLPFRGDNAVEIALKHLKEPMPSLREELPNIAQSIENVVIKATAKNPKNRYNDAREMYEDLKTVLDDSRKEEPKYVYKYSENDLDDTKIMQVIKDKEIIAASNKLNKKEKVKEEKEKEVEDKDVVVKKITEKDLKKNDNKTLLVLGAIFTGLVLITTAIVVLLPKLTTSKNVEVPDVRDMSVVNADKALRKAGLEVATETIKQNSTEIEEGNVVKTDPASGRTVKEGTTVTIYESAGNNKILVENYLGKSYIEIKAKLDVLGINVIIEKEEVDNPEEYEINEIIKQSKEAGEYISEGETFTLTIADIEIVYPDFVVDGYTVEEIQAFCDDHEVTLTIEYVESADVPAGTVTYQSRPKGYKIIAGATLTIRVAQEPETEDTEGDFFN